MHIQVNVRMENMGRFNSDMLKNSILNKLLIKISQHGNFVISL